MERKEAAHEPRHGDRNGRAQEVDEDELRKYVERGIEAKRVPFEYTNARDVLARLGLLCDDGTLTNAAMVCFVDRSEVGLRMGVLADSHRTQILDNQQISGSLFHLVDAGEYYIVNNIRRAFVIDGSSLHRKEVPEIPMPAIREALFNAFDHRDFLDLAAVQADIFWDKVYIYSPGGFPPGVSPEAYMSGRADASRPRNPLIVRTLYRSGDIEAYGTGLQRIKRACDAQGTPVEVYERGRSVHVVFTRQEALDDSRRLGPFASADNPPETADSLPTMADNGRQVADKDLSSNGRRVLDYVTREGRAATAQIAEALNMSERTARRTLANLVSRGILLAEGANKNRTYTPRNDE